MAYSYTYYSDTKDHGGWTATMQVSCGHELVTTNDTVTIKMEGAAQYSSNNATGYGVHVQVGHDAVSSPSYSKRQADGYGVLNYSNWVGSAKGSFAFSRTHSAYNVWIWSAAWGETVSGYGAAPESAGGGKTITIPAKPSYSVTFNANGGSGAPSAQTKWYNESLTLSSTKPTRTNYVFKNWNTKSDGSGTAYSSGASYTGNAALALYAQWYAPYTVSFNANGGSGAPSNQTKVYNTPLTLSTTKPTRTGYTFKNWNTKSDGTGTSYASGANYTANAAVTLYAIWQINTWAVTYDGNGATGGSTASQTKTYGQALALRSNGFTKTNHNFVNWNTAANGSGTAYSAGASYTGNAALKLYAQWRVAHSNPTISNLSVKRCTSDGVENVEGTYMKVDAAWSVDNTTSSFEDTVGSTFKVTVNGVTDTVSLSGTSGTISRVHQNSGGTKTEVAIGSSYKVTSVLEDSKGYTVSRTSDLSVAYFTMHFKAGGTGVGIGKPSTVDNLLDVGMPTSIAGTLDTTGKITSLGNVQAQCYLILRANGDNYSAIRTIPATSNTSGRTGDAIRFYGTQDNADGDEIVIGNGGHVIVGAGESGTNLRTALGAAASNETLELASDNAVNIYSTCNTIANRLRWQFNASANAPFIYADCGAASSVAVGTSATNGVTANTNLGGLYLRDKNTYWTGVFYSRTGASGDILAGIGVRNQKTDGTNVSNYINLLVLKDGTQSYSISNPTNFRSAIAAANKPTQLYNNTTGSTGTVTLSATAANYNHMRIYYRSNDSEYSSVDVFTPNGKKVDLLQATPNSGGNTYLKSRSVTISGTSIATSANTEATIYNGASSQASSSSKATIYIVRVEGWNE